MIEAGRAPANERRDDDDDNPTTAASDVRGRRSAEDRGPSRAPVATLAQPSSRLIARPHPCTRPSSAPGRRARYGSRARLRSARPWRAPRLGPWPVPFLPSALARPRAPRRAQLRARRPRRPPARARIRPPGRTGDRWHGEWTRAWPESSRSYLEQTARGARATAHQPPPTCSTSQDELGIATTPTRRARGRGLHTHHPLGGQMGQAAGRDRARPLAPSRLRSRSAPPGALLPAGARRGERFSRRRTQWRRLPSVDGVLPARVPAPPPPLRPTVSAHILHARRENVRAPLCVKLQAGGAERCARSVATAHRMEATRRKTRHALYSTPERSTPPDDTFDEESYEPPRATV